MLNETQSSLSTPLDETAAAEPVPKAAPSKAETAARLQRLRKKFEDQLSAMWHEADRESEHRLFVDCLTWQLAYCVVRFGTGATGDIISKLGANVTRIHEYVLAQEEAERALKEGAPVH